jgi:hypothetical protein
MGRDSIATTALVTSADGDTLWIAVPLPLLADSTSAVAVCTSELRGFAQTHTPWVDVRLR